MSIQSQQDIQKLLAIVTGLSCKPSVLVVLQNIDLAALLSSIHNFFEDLGLDEIRRRASRDDKPLRMVKTILHELCKLKGSEIYRYTDHIQVPQSASGQTDARPVIFPYIDLNLSTLQNNSQRPMTAGMCRMTKI